MNLRGRLALLTGLERQASRWSPEQYRKGMDAYTRLQRLSLVVARRMVLGSEELPEPYSGVEADAALVAEMRERQGFQVAPAIGRAELAEGANKRRREIILAMPEWLCAVWRFHPPCRKQDREHWSKLRAEGRSHLAPWWVGDRPDGGDPVPWPPDPGELWEGRF